MDTNIVKIYDYVQEIKSNSIVLPNFQRNFKWKDYKMQRAFVASVIAKLPIGTILTLEQNKSEFACRRIGEIENLNMNEMPDKVNLLIDGQQRSTVLISIFTKLLNQGNFVDKKIVSETLYRVWYYKFSINFLDNENSDVFDSKFLNQLIDRNQMPSFVTADIIDNIYFIDPKSKNEIEKKIINNSIDNSSLAQYCSSYDIHNNNYYIPLNLLYGAVTGNNNDSNALNEICKLIGESIKSRIIQFIADDKISDKYKKDYLFKYDKTIILNDDIKKHPEKLFENQNEQRLLNWSNNIQSYFKSCIENIDLRRVNLKDKEKNRAIDIFENMNKGGIALNVYDLLSAKASTDDSDKTLTDIIINKINSNSDEYKKNIEILISNIHIKHIQQTLNEYNGNLLLKFKCYDEKNLEINEKYLKNVINLLGIFDYFKINGKIIDNDWKENIFANISNFSSTALKRENLLGICSNIIKPNTKLACDGINRAIMFLQTRCGIREISEIKYNYILTTLSFVFLNDDWFKNRMDEVEAWYWSVIFAGKYCMEQNRAFSDNFKNLIQYLSEKNDYLFNLSKACLSNDNFISQKMIKNISNINSIDSEIGDLICQYYLSYTYNDIIKDDILYSKKNVKNKVLSTLDEYSDTYQKHHIIPINEISANLNRIYSDVVKGNNQRSDRNDIYNSPLNFVYITKESNGIISNATLSDYIKYCDNTSITDLNISIEDNTKIESFLINRFDKFKTKLTKRLRELLYIENLIFDIDV